MRICVVVYSETGNTLSVAQKIVDRLNGSGNEAVLEAIRIVGKVNPSDRNVQFERLPSLEGYDALVFCSPVHGFSLAQPMAQFVPQAPSLAGKKAAAFVTQTFPYPWMGGNRSLSQLIGLLRRKGALVAKAGIANWSSKRRPDQIQAIVGETVRILLG